MPISSFASRSTKLTQAVVTMPPRAHCPNATFDWMESEVANWLCAQPSMRQYMFDKCRGAGLIVFNQATGTWRGRDWRAV